MKLRRLIWRECKHRKLNGALSLLAVVIATACAVGAVTLVRARDMAAAQRTRQLRDDMRKITKRMGFNILILPKGQDLGELYSNDYATKYMPREYADKLAGSSIVTINHILPSLEQRVQWPERNGRTIRLIGVSGQVPLAHHDPRKKPIMQAVPPGTIVLGAELARTEGLKVGARVELMGQSFEVSKVHAERGDKQDITVWIDLPTAQNLLEKPGQINAIWALECGCALADLPQVRREIEEILPDTQVIELGGKALARAEARQQTERIDEDLRDQRKRFASLLVPLVTIAAGVWVGLLSLANVRERRTEIGVLRAIGVRSRQVLTIFLGKAVLIGLAGAAIGYALGFFVAAGLASSFDDGGTVAALFDPWLLLLVMALAPALAALASWLPALLAVLQDPAAVLREE